MSTQNSSTPFNFETIQLNGKTFITAQRWRSGYTVPESFIVREVSDDEAEGLAS